LEAGSREAVKKISGWLQRRFARMVGVSFVEFLFVYQSLVVIHSSKLATAIIEHGVRTQGQICFQSPRARVLNGHAHPV
jgi:hypothetical protein